MEVEKLAKKRMVNLQKLILFNFKCCYSKRIIIQSSLYIAKNWKKAEKDSAHLLYAILKVYKKWKFIRCTQS